jgi:hypothetical protein
VVVIRDSTAVQTGDLLEMFITFRGDLPFRLVQVNPAASDSEQLHHIYKVLGSLYLIPAVTLVYWLSV